MPDLNDFHAFNSTSGGSNSGGGGCSWRLIVGIVIIVGILILIGKCSV